MFVNLGKDRWGHALAGESLNSSGGSVGAGVCDRDDGDRDDGVEDGWKSLDVGKFESQDEWRVSGIGTGSSREILLIRSDDGAENEKGDDVEEGDTPEDLLGSLGNGLSWVVRLSSGKTDKLSSSESERCGDEDGTESLKTVLECSWLSPERESKVTTVVGWDTAAVDDYTEDDETNNSANLDKTKNELDFSVTLDTKKVDGDDQNQKYGDPDSVANTWGSGVVRISPELQCDTSGNKFERKDNQPVERVVPSHGKTPSWIDEANRVVVKRTVDRVAKGGLSAEILMSRFSWRRVRRRAWLKRLTE